ncbi:error-prone DNA polymerase [Lutibaculum baratangense]|uniref:Error-prone DNA polymerase n=1 Tax=Lutibaculum baratangense AMV1 TaxID=631454 RepID=V4RLA9_9HYPH|nr:error-prone DNA polymerase [Lutibaculum baratangense]ESR26094.1 DNA polymerase III alpha subunit [Lutibaculum baratangense AMV1]
MLPFAELCTTTNFSFLRGASHAEELVRQAALLKLRGLGVVDRNTLSGIVRAHSAAKEIGLPFRVGTRLVFADGTPNIFAWPRDRAAYGRLCRLLTLGNRRAKKGDCELTLQDLLAHGEGVELAFAPLRSGRVSPLVEPLKILAEAFPDHVRLAASMGYGGADRRHLGGLVALGQEAGVKLLATNDPIYHVAARRELQDVVTCIREGTTLAAAGRRLEVNAERHLKSPREMARLFRDLPEAVAETVALMQRLVFSLDELKYQYPDEPTGESATPAEELARLAWEGAAKRYPHGVPEKVKGLVAHELKLIGELQYEPYFLTVHDIVRFARSRGILCQGRGSAANSAVCFCLGVTEVDPERMDVLFERFVSAERREPPDIDVDFEHERREEVIQYIYQRYGRERAGIAATVITYRARSALREVGKVFGLSEDVAGGLAGQVWGISREDIGQTDLKRRGLDPHDPGLKRMIRLAREIIGFPRHLSQHVGGFVITRDRLDETIPVGNAAMADRTFVEWDKDDLDELGILKIDVLALGMLTCIRKAFDFVRDRYGRELTLATIPPEENAVYRMLSRADSLGVFQVESRAQMSMLPRLKPKEFYDLVIEVAIVRPGPIQGDMVHPYLRRREGKERVSYPSPAPAHGPRDELKSVLGKTLGVPLFQEQAMRIAIVAAGFTPSEADQLRRAMATFRKVGTIGTFEKKMVEGMVKRGYRREFAERCFSQIEGFGEYGFPESHAASFALLVYASSWLKCRYPDAFAAALLNSQPMGFYAPAQIVRDAAEHGVGIRPVDVNLSDWDCTLEQDDTDASPERPPIHPMHADQAGDILSTHAIRLGLRQVKGLSEADMRLLVERRGRGYDSVRDLWLRSGLTASAIARLADADAFASLGLDRRTAMWAARGLDPGGAAERMPLFEMAGLGTLQKEPDVNLPPMPPGEEVVHDYRFLRLSLKAHPVSFLREALNQRRTLRHEVLRTTPTGRTVTVAGLVLVRQRPGSAKGVIFMTLEDETGIANVIVWPKAFERFRPEVLGGRFVSVTGQLQKEGEVIHVVARKIEDLSHMLTTLCDEGGEVETLSRADAVKNPGIDMRDKVSRTDKRQKMLGLPPQPPAANANAELREVATAMPKGRNFH